MKAKRAGSGQSGKNLRCFIRASKANCDKALELLAGYRSFPPVGPSIWKSSWTASRQAVTPCRCCNWNKEVAHVERLGLGKAGRCEREPVRDPAGRLAS